MIKMLRLFLMAIIFFELPLFAMLSNDEEQLIASPYRTKKAAMVSLLGSRNQQGITCRFYSQAPQEPVVQSQWVSFSVKKNVFACFKRAWKFLCLE